MGERDRAVARAKTVIQTLLTKGAMAAIAALFPFLKLPVIGTLVEYMVGKIAEYMVTQGEFQAFAYMIDERTDAQTKEFFDAAIGLSKAEKLGDKDAIKKYQAALIKAHDKFGSLRS